MIKKVVKIKKEIEIRKGYIAELRSRLDGVSAIDYSKDKVQGGDNSPDGRMVKLLHKIIKQEQTIEQLKNQISKLEDAINQVDDTEERQILILRYLMTRSWKEICGKLYISYATAKRKHCNAIEKLREIYKNELS